MLLFCAGKFKGLSNKYDISIDDLVDLLHSVDHEKVVNQDAVISDNALAALLDRTLTNEDDKTGENRMEDVDPHMTMGNHGDLFKVIAERDCQGKLICPGDEDKDSGQETGSSLSSTFSSTSPEPTPTAEVGKHTSVYISSSVSAANPPAPLACGGSGLKGGNERVQTTQPEI